MASVLIVDDAYAAAAMLPLAFAGRAALPDGTPLDWHIATSAVAAQSWLNERRPASVAVAVLDIDLGTAETGAALVPQLRVSPALRGDACIVIWSGRDDGAIVAHTAGADAFLSKQRMGRSKIAGCEILAIVARLWRADVRRDPRPWIARG